MDDLLRDLLANLIADRDGLLCALIERLDDSMLDEIARLDYGWQAEAHRASLDAILAARRVNRELINGPYEVLQLGSFGQPDDDCGHAMRAFCACCLLHVPEYGPGGDIQTTGRLLESVLALDAGLAEHTRRFLVWQVRNDAHDRDMRLFDALGVLLLQTRLAVEDHLWFDRAIHWLEVEESCIRAELAPVDERWVWGVMGSRHDPDAWLKLVQSLLVDAEHKVPSLRLLGERLVTAHAAKRRTRHPK